MIQIICGHIGNTENFSQTGNLSKDFDKRSPLGRSYRHFTEIIFKKNCFCFHELNHEKIDGEIRLS